MAHPAPATVPRPAGELHARVLAWFGANARDLPWRAADRTPWSVLVSEVMLQQTPVVRVLPAWLDWMARWPDPAALAAASPAEVLRAWDRLGYPRRALRLRECARAIVAEHGGRVPSDEAALRALPGVGAYTAAAVLAFAYGRRAVVLDTNVRRVLARCVDGLAAPPPHQSVAEVRRAEALVPADDATAARWSLAVMELGALVCTARTPGCEACPLSELCAWRAAGSPPPATAPRGQAWAGTDRQVRGRVMAALRAAGTVDRLALADVWHDETQLERCLASLVADGLADHDAATATYRLPVA